VTDLPELVIDVTPTFVVASAIATRDFQDVHHDRDRAVERGSKDIFINILTTTGLVQRYVTDWAGPEALVRKVAIRLGVPCYAGDTLTFSGRAAAADAGGEVEVTVTGRCSLGDHVTGTVRLMSQGVASSMYQRAGSMRPEGTSMPSAGASGESGAAPEAEVADAARETA
jgi:3-oxo-4,17-pregnadiene-20-carboxyl-CoA hydratase beta subunit